MLLVEHRPKLGTVVFEQEIFTDGAGDEGRPGEIGLADIIVNELDQPGRDTDGGGLGRFRQIGEGHQVDSFPRLEETPPRPEGAETWAGMDQSQTCVQLTR